MFHFRIMFIYVLYISIRSSVSSFSVLASFNESCSENHLCQFPLICSNRSQCICSITSSIWNEKFKDCFYCPMGWIPWENNRCLSFAIPASGGVSYEQANATCQSFSAELFSINNQIELKQFDSQVNQILHETFSSAVFLYFRLGAWINRYEIDTYEDIWCDDQSIDLDYNCVYIRRNSRKNNSLCLSRLICQEKMPFICQMKTISERYSIINEQSNSSNQRFAQMLGELLPLAVNLLGDLFNPNQQNQQTTAPPAPPQQIIIQHDSLPAPQAASSDKTILIIGYFIVGLILLIFLCGGIGLLIYFLVYVKNSTSIRQTNQRQSVESTSSNV